MKPTGHGTNYGTSLKACNCRQNQAHRPWNRPWNKLWNMAPARKVAPGGIQRVVLEHFRHQPAKWYQEASRGSFGSISGTSPQSGPRRPPEGRFGAFQAPARKVVPGGRCHFICHHFYVKKHAKIAICAAPARLLVWKVTRTS